MKNEFAEGVRGFVNYAMLLDPFQSHGLIIIVFVTDVTVCSFLNPKQ